MHHQGFAKFGTNLVSFDPRDCVDAVQIDANTRRPELIIVNQSTLPDVQLRFYDSVAHRYILMFESWELVVGKTSVLLKHIFSDPTRISGIRVLCPMVGPGTEAIAAASLGCNVSALDLSPAMIAFAEEEAKRRGLDIDFGIADVMSLPPDVKQQSFDAAVVLGNSVCCLHSDEDLVHAFSGVRATLAESGVLILGLRNYDDTLTSIAQDAELINQPCECVDGRRIWQEWQFREEQGLGIYDCRLRVDLGSERLVDEHVVCRAWDSRQVDAALLRAGFSKARWIDNRSPEPVYRAGLDSWVAVARAK